MGWLGGCRRAGLSVGASQCSLFVLPAASPAARGGDPAGKCALGTAKGQPRGTSRIHWVSGWAKLRSVKLIPWLWLDPTSSTASSFPTLSTVPHSMPWFESRWIGAWSWSLEHSTPLTFEKQPQICDDPEAVKPSSARELLCPSRAALRRHSPARSLINISGCSREALAAFRAPVDQWQTKGCRRRMLQHRHRSFQRSPSLSHSKSSSRAQSFLSAERSPAFSGIGAAVIPSTRSPRSSV